MEASESNIVKMNLYLKLILKSLNVNCLVMFLFKNLLMKLENFGIVLFIRNLFHFNEMIVKDLNFYVTFSHVYKIYPKFIFILE